jgi:hypothetical protein
MKIKRFSEGTKSSYNLENKPKKHKFDHTGLSIEELIDKLDELATYYYLYEKTYKKEEYEYLKELIIDKYNRIQDELDAKYEEEAGAGL